MEYPLFDSSFNSEELDKLIAETPILEVLRYMGEIRVEVEGTISKEDNRFSAPYGDYNATGGSVDKVVDGLVVEWFPDESDLEHLKENESVPARLVKELEALMRSEPRTMIRYNLTKALTDKEIESIKEAYLEE